MKRKIQSVFIVFILLLMGYLFLKYAREVMSSVIFSFNLWQNNLLPSLLPFFIIAELMIQYGFVEFLGEIFNYPMKKIFHMPGECSFVLVMSMLSGFPSGAKYTKQLLDENIIDESTANRLLTFTHFSNPLFVIGTIGITFLHSQKIGLIILLSHIISNFIIAFLIRPKQYNDTTYHKTQHNCIYRGFQKMHQYRITKSKTFATIMNQAIMNTFKTLFLMLGIVSFFLIITTLVQQLLPLTNLEKAMVSSLFEMTQGLKTVSVLSLSPYWKGMWMSGIISFGGLSVHLQILSVLTDSKIKYSSFFLARILHVILTIIIYSLIYMLS